MSASIPPASPPWTTASQPNHSLSLLTDSLSISTSPHAIRPPSLATPITSISNINVGVQVMGVVSPPTPAPSPTPKRMAEGGTIWDDDTSEDMDMALRVKGKGKGRASGMEVSGDVSMGNDEIHYRSPRPSDREVILISSSTPYSLTFTYTSLQITMDMDIDADHNPLRPITILDHTDTMSNILSPNLLNSTNQLPLLINSKSPLDPNPTPLNPLQFIITSLHPKPAAIPSAMHNPTHELLYSPTNSPPRTKRKLSPLSPPPSPILPTSIPLPSLTPTPTPTPYDSTTPPHSPNSPTLTHAHALLTLSTPTHLTHRFSSFPSTRPPPAPENLLATFKSLTPSSRFAFLAGLVAELELHEALVVSRNLEPRLRRDFLRELPGELGLHCLSFVEDAKTLSRAAQVSTHWNNLLQDEQTWKDMCSRHRFTGIISPIEYPEKRTPVLVASDRFGGRGVGGEGRVGGAGGGNEKSFKSQFKNAYLTESNWLTSGRLLASHIATDDGVVTSIALNDIHMLIGMANSKLHVFNAVTGTFRKSLIGHELGVWTVVLISPYAGSGTGKAGVGPRNCDVEKDNVDMKEGKKVVMEDNVEPKSQTTRPALGFSRLRKIGRRVVTDSTTLPPSIASSSSTRDLHTPNISSTTPRSTYRDEGVARRASFNGPGLFGRVGAPVDVSVPLPGPQPRISAYVSGPASTGAGHRNRRNHGVSPAIEGRISTFRRAVNELEDSTRMGLGFGGLMGGENGPAYQSHVGSSSTSPSLGQASYQPQPQGSTTSSFDITSESNSTATNDTANANANGLGVNIFPMPGHYPTAPTRTQNSAPTGANGNGGGKKGIPRATKKMRQSDVCNSARGWAGLKRTLGVSAGCDKRVMVWDVEKGTLLHDLSGHTSTIRCLKVLDRRPIAVSGSRDHSVRVWDIEKGECMHVLNGHTGSVRCVEIAGNQIVSGSYDFTCRLWDADTGECIHVLSGHYHQIYAVAFDGERIVTGSLDSSVRIWSASTGECTALLQGHTSLVGQLQLTDNILTTGGSDGRVIIFDLNTMTCVHRLCAHDNSVTCLQFNDRFVVSGGNDGRVKLWDARSGVFIRELTRHCDAVWRVAFREDRVVILCQRKGKTIMEILTFRPQDVGTGRKVR